MIVAARRHLALALASALLLMAAAARASRAGREPFAPAPAGPLGALVVDVRGGLEGPAAEKAIRYALAASVRPTAPGRRPARWLDRAVVLRQRGRLWLPGRGRRTAKAAAQEPAITFVYQGQGWSAAEEQVLGQYITAAYPAIESVYGPPPYSLTVTIVKDIVPSPYGGTYNASTNQIRLPPIEDAPRDTYLLAVLMVRAWHDDLMFDFDAWETGFASAAGLVAHLEASAALGYAFDPTFDLTPYVLPLYELFNQPALASPRFLPASGYAAMTFWRIGMAQAAWLKVYAENPDFFSAFNAAYYAQAPPPGDIAALKDIAKDIVPTVEGVGFADWYRRQRVLDTEISLGQKVFVAAFPGHEAVGLELDYYQTTESGDETPLGGTATLRYLGYQGLLYYPEEGDRVAVPASGPDAGIGTIAPTFFNVGGSQRITIEVALGQVGATTYYPYGVYGAGAEPNAVFGVVTDAQSGTVGFHRPDEAEHVEPVVRGAFVFALGEALYGFARTALRFTDASGRSYRRQVNTGPGYYLPVLRARPGQRVTISRDFDPGVRMVGFPVYPIASDEAAALGIPADQLLLAHWKPDRAGAYKYVFYPNTPPIEPHIGYWINLPEAREIAIEGIVPAPDQDYRVHLLAGWNQVANPFQVEVATSQMAVLDPARGTLPFSTARSSYWVSSLRRYAPGQGYTPASGIRAWESVWIYCYPSAGVWLIISPT